MSKTRNLYRVAEGEVTPIGVALEAIVDGVYDENNWATDWVIVSARNEPEALAIARTYDAKTTSGARARPSYLHPISSTTSGHLRGAR